MTGSAVKDSRWFSFWDNGMAWDRQWHSLAVCHAFSFWLEGRNPWSLGNAGDASEDSHSMRSFCWHVLRLHKSPKSFECSSHGPH